METFIQKLVNSDYSGHFFQAYFNLKDIIYAAVLVRKDIKACTLRRA